MMNIRIFLLCIALLPECFCGDDNAHHPGPSSETDGRSRVAVTQRALDAALHRKFIIFNSELSTIAEICGDIPPTAANFKPGNALLKILLSDTQLHISNRFTHSDVKMIAGNVEYVEREFMFQSDLAFPFPPNVLSGNVGDTPTVIARMIEAGINRQDIHQRYAPIFFVSGDDTTGKSTSLAKIQLEISQYMPKVWTIRTDLSNVLKDIRPDDIKLTTIVNEHISPPFIELFNNLMEINARRIVLLLDGLDRITHNQLREVVSIIDSITKKGATVVAVGREYTLMPFRRRSLTLIVYKISEMTFSETKKYLANVWKSMMEQLTNTEKGPSPPKKLKISIPPTHSERLEEYVTAFATTLLKTSFPRTSMMLKPLAYTFWRIPSRLSSVLSNAIFEVGCLDYILGSSSSLAPTIDTVIEQILFNKVSFFDERVRTLFHRYNDIAINMYHLLDVDIYGPLAVMNTVFRTAEHAHKKIRFQTSLEDQIEELRNKPWSELKYVNFDASSKYNYKFIHSDFMHYFAAKYILQLLEKNSFPVDLGIEVFRNPDYISILEFINGEAASISYKAFKRIFMTRGRLRTDVLDNLLKFGLQDLFVQLSQIISRSHWKYRACFEAYIEDDHPLGYRVKQVFGMIPVKNKQTMNPDVYGMPLRNRLELLVEQNMVGVLSSMPNFIKQFNQLEDYHRLLRIVVTRDLPDLDNFKIVLQLCKNSLVNAGDLLFQTIDTVGPACRPITDILIKPAGSNLQIINEDGRTLLHAAVKWHSQLLLQYVVETLHVPAVDFPDYHGKTVFVTALNAHPLSLLSARDWWEMMLYLMKHVKYLSAENIENTIMIPDPDYDSPNAFKSVRLNNQMSVLEVLIHYRGRGPMLMKSRKYYRMIIGHMIAKGDLTPAVRTQVINALVDNIGNVDDLSDCKFAIDLGLLQGVESRLYSPIISKIQDRFPVVNVDGPLTSSQTSQRDTFNHEVTQLLESIKKQIESSSNAVDIAEEGPIDLTNCLTRHTRRAATLSPCHFSWEDVNDFNDADKRGTIKQIRVNSDKFLEKLAIEEFRDKIKAQQLMHLLKQLPRVSDATDGIITGKFQMLLRDVLEHQSLTAYRQKLRIRDIMSDVSKQLSRKKSFAFRFPSKTVALHAAAAIPLIRGIYGTIVTCRQEINGTNKNCWIGSSALVLSITSMPINVLASRYVPRTIQWLSRTTLDILPSTAPHVLRQNVLHLRRIGLKYGTSTVVHGLTIAGMGYDVYNIIEMSKMINECSKQGNECLSKDKIEYIISLTFSCVSIAVIGGLILSGAGFAAGAIIGLALVVLESFALGINEVVYYSNQYKTDWGENVNIFLHKITFQPPPADVQALAQRTDWVINLQQHVTSLLESSNEDIVAYGTGIGTFRNGEVIAGAGSINMAEVDVKHTRGLSRIIPTTRNNTTMLCLPKQDKFSNYDKHPNNVSDAVYGCRNSFIIAYKKRWEKRFSDKSFILYSLEYIDEGNIVGSNTLNNMFSISNGTTALTVKGGVGNISNTFVVRNDLFRGVIIVDSQSRSNVLDLSATESAILEFSWSTRLILGRVKFGDNDEDAFSVVTSDSPSPNLHVIGRPNKVDMITCNYNQHHRITERQITADGGGGQSYFNMDHVRDCLISVIRPFTHIKGSNSSSVVYTAHVWLEYAVLTPTTTVFATIEPQQSKFIVLFINRPLFLGIYSLQYTPRNKTLIWNLRYIDSSSLFLSIVSYHSGNSLLQENTTVEELDSMNCIFIDSYSGITVVPVIHQPADEISIITVRHFNVLATVNSSRLEDAIGRYRDISIYASEELHTVTKLTYPETGKSFTFGSNTNDRFYIDGNTTFLFGGNGCDIYMLNRESSNFVLIDNEANDDALDTLIIVDTMCDSLHAECNNSLYDVSLLCSVNRATSTPLLTHVVLRNYLLDPRHRHLQIHWHDAMYVLLPGQWTSQDHQDHHSADIPKSIDLAILFSFRDDWPFTTLTLTSRDTYVILNITDEATNPLVAYRSGFNDIILSRKYLDDDSSSFVVLQKFFSDNTTNITKKWLQMKIFIVNHTMDDAIMPKTLTVSDILKLFLETRVVDNTTDKQAIGDFIDEYFVNVTDTSRSNTIIIEHNNNSVRHGLSKLGVLTVIGAEPKEFHVYWRDGGTSLSLCARDTCIYVKNWCRPIHRLYRMEFISSFDRRPIVIPHMDRIKCQYNQSNNNICPLDTIFINAQHQLLLANNDDDSDNSRLVRCVSSIFVDYVAQNSMHRPLGFTSVVEQEIFMRENCRILFTRPDLKKVSMAAMNGTLENTFKKYEMSGEATSEEEASILLVRKVFSKLDNFCWEKFMAFLYNLSNTTEYNINVSLQKLDDLHVICQ